MTLGTHGVSSLDLSQASRPRMWEPRENSVGPALRSRSMSGMNTYGDTQIKDYEEEEEEEEDGGERKKIEK